MDEPRPGAPRTITDAEVEHVIALTLETKPKAATHWSTRAMAHRSGLSQTAVSRIWRAFGLQPHRSETFKLSKIRCLSTRSAISSACTSIRRTALVLCVDEKSQIQALDRTQPVLPMRPGQVERHTHDYARHGTTTLFAALDVKSGEIIGEFHQRHRAREFRTLPDDHRPGGAAALEIHLILDNDSTHKTPLIHRWLLRHPRFHVHFTPTSGSWMNLVERWFAALTEKQMRRGVHRSTREFEAAISRYIDITNDASQAVQMGENGRRDLGERRALLSSNL